jgi:Arginine decarboxylase C-terminal helical extension
VGDTYAVHVSLDASDAVVLDAVIKDDAVRELLDYVEFDTAALMAKLRSDVETAVRGSRLDVEGRPTAPVLRRRSQRVHVPRRKIVDPLFDRNPRMGPPNVGR